jgi:aspartate kinase
MYNKWMDARGLIITDSTYRAARVDWEESRRNIISAISGDIIVTQGFIGSDGNYSTTLGREGSDFSAAIFANILDAEEVVVWKDVPGYLNADPRYFDDTIKLDSISYAESIELAFYGAKIIHPKTIRPLKNKSIPLKVRSFLEPESEGSVIHNDHSSDALVPSCIIKDDQVLMSIAARDFSFIAEDKLHTIFGLFTKHRCGINLMQNSAISFSVCVDNNPRLETLIHELQEEFKVKYNDGLQLITIRHYDQETIGKLTAGKEILLEQRSRITVQMVVK